MTRNQEPGTGGPDIMGIQERGRDHDYKEPGTMITRNQGLFLKGTRDLDYKDQGPLLQGTRDHYYKEPGTIITRNLGP